MFLSVLKFEDVLSSDSDVNCCIIVNKAMKFYFFQYMVGTKNTILKICKVSYSWYDIT